MNQLNRALKKSLLFIILSIIGILLLNIIITIIVFRSVVSNIQVNKIESNMNTISNSLTIEDTKYIMKEEGIKVLDDNGAWAMLLDKDKGNVKWSMHLPGEIPTEYSITDIAKFSRYYLEDYPVFTWEHKGDLIVVGFPKDSYTKLSSNYQYIDIIKKLPIFIISIVILDIFALIILFFSMDYFTMKKINPTIEGINNMKEGIFINLQEKGTFAEINSNLNKTSKALEKKDLVRANWVASVSHDIRTPLTVIIGYVDSLKKDKYFDEESEKKLNKIENQCVKIKNLVNDLNLYSKIEHNTKFLREEKFKVVPLFREIIVEYINNIDSENYIIDYDLDDSINDVSINGDKTMIKRALENLLNNSIIHNPNGCNIEFKATLQDSSLVIIIKDDGVGMKKEDVFFKESNYIDKDESLINSKHGLGLVISRKIIEKHGGILEIQAKDNDGFKSSIFIPY